VIPRLLRLLPAARIQTPRLWTVFRRIPASQVKDIKGLPAAALHRKKSYPRGIFFIFPLAQSHRIT